MRKIVVVFGPSGAGKSSLAWRLIEETGGLGAWPLRNPAPQVHGHENADCDLWLIGRYEKGFPYSGVDRLSMSVQPHLEKFVAGSQSDFFVEGDRICNRKFYRFLLGLPDTEVLIIYLTVREDVVAPRRVARGDDRDERFYAIRRTKHENILASVPGIEVCESNDAEDQEKIWGKIESFLELS